MDNSISIVIPAYNVENYLEATLNSVYAQEVLPDEVLVVDDGSTDGTKAIIEGYHNKGIRYIHTPNQGQGAARNLGMALAKSEYIYFLDADDQIAPNLIKNAKDHIYRHSPDLILFSGETRINRDFSNQLPKFLGKDGDKLNRNISGVFLPNDGLLYKLLYNNGIFPSPCCYISKRTLWFKNRIGFPTVLYEDHATFLSIVTSSKKTVVDPEIYFFYHLRPNSTTTSPIADRNLESALYILLYLIWHITSKQNLNRRNIKAWRKLIRYFGILYIRYCKQLGRSVSLIQLLSCMLYARKITYPFRILLEVLLPRRAIATLRQAKHNLRK